MKIIWDEHKRIANLDKHGYDFLDFDYNWLDYAMIEQTHSNRFKAYLTLHDGTVIIIFATLGREAVSIISVRDANRTERNKLC